MRLDGRWPNPTRRILCSYPFTRALPAAKEAGQEMNITFIDTVALELGNAHGEMGGAGPSPPQSVHQGGLLTFILPQQSKQVLASKLSLPGRNNRLAGPTLGCREWLLLLEFFISIPVFLLIFLLSRAGDFVFLFLLTGAALAVMAVSLLQGRDLGRLRVVLPGGCREKGEAGLSEQCRGHRAQSSSTWRSRPQWGHEA